MFFSDFQDFLVDLDSMRDMHGGFGPRACEVIDTWAGYKGGGTHQGGHVHAILTSLVKAGVVEKTVVTGNGTRKSAHYKTRR